MIAESMIKVLKKNNRTNVWYGDIELIEECAKLSGIRKNHPKDLIQCILNALDKSPYFKKGYITADFDGKNRKYRCFTLL